MQDARFTCKNAEQGLYPCSSNLWGMVMGTVRHIPFGRGLRVPFRPFKHSSQHHPDSFTKNTNHLALHKITTKYKCSPSGSTRNICRAILHQRRNPEIVAELPRPRTTKRCRELKLSRCVGRMDWQAERSYADARR